MFSQSWESRNAESTALRAEHQQPNTHQHHNKFPLQQHHPYQFDLQTHHYMSETSQCPGDDEHDDLSASSSQRRAKRVIPEMEKDEKYWEKRKRNNMAAKRSRENKRSHINVIMQKVSCMQETNALLSKELAFIRERYGVPPGESIMTPEEREQCNLEIKNFTKSAEAKCWKDISSDNVSSTSPNVSQSGLQQILDESIRSRPGSSGSSSNSPRVVNKSHNSSLAYGQSTYGPFMPPPSWVPAGAVDIQSFQENSQFQNCPQQQTNQSKVASTSHEVQEKSSAPYNYYLNHGMANFVQSPYNYYMQYTNPGGQMLYGGVYHGANSDVDHAEPADLSIRGQKVEKGVRGGIEDVALNARSTRTGMMPSNIHRHISNSNTSFTTSSSGHAQNSQDQFCKGLKLPHQISTSSSSNYKQTAASPYADNPGNFKHPDPNHFRRENEALKMNVQTFAEPTKK